VNKEEIIATRKETGRKIWTNALFVDVRTVSRRWLIFSKIFDSPLTSVHAFAASGQEMMKGRVCSHHFHSDCGMKWLEESDRCALCRALLVTPEEFREAARETLGADRVRDIANFTRLEHDEIMIIFSYPSDMRSEGQSSTGSTDEESTISDEDLDSIFEADSDSSRW
jgi:hypothetical protein